ncbi:MAG: phage major tail tube protein [Paenirhodobacter sp.]|uniref:phage major tail tube protein n=1 Tax=Paenirhodobacter sp. TaxID=1965326 RepID=UPI003D1245EF
MRDILKYIGVFVDGYGYAGLATSAKVPKIEIAVREYKAAGMSGPIEVRMARLANVLSCELTFEGFDPHLYETLSIGEGASIPLTVKGSAEDADGATHAHKITMRGFAKVIDEGEWKEGEGVPLKLEISLRYYKRERDGVELYEIDQENMVFKVKGKDLLAEHRANISR